MSTATVRTYVVRGLSAYPVDLVCEIRLGLPTFDLIGFDPATVRDVRALVLRELRPYVGLEWPGGPVASRVTVTAATVGPELGVSHVWPAALAVLSAMGEVANPIPPCVGEEAVGLAQCVMAMAPDTHLLFPDRHAAEALAMQRDDVHLLVAPTLDAAVKGEWALLADALEQRVDQMVQESPARTLAHRMLDWCDVRDSTQALGLKRVLEIAAAGGHHTLILENSGLYPVSGVMMLARRMPGILPPLSIQERRILIQMQSGLRAGLDTTTIAGWRPLRAPLYSTVGMPNEAALAYGGVLALEDLPEYLPETHAFLVDKPGRYTIVATSPHVSRLPVLQKARGLLGLFDLQWRAPSVDAPCDDGPRETSEDVRARVAAAWARQDLRYGGECLRNGRVDPGTFMARAFDTIEPAALEWAAEHAAARYGQKHVDAELAPLCRLARTIADLRDVDTVQMQDLSEALDMRAMSEPQDTKKRRAK
uniref:Putative ATP-dependent protease n=1 Tax=uncultured Caudovirales phage TaxID=2100421 RepID=A0A6J5L2Z5_9CAUD|nr:putative ATP-dependent protease [uncultured Caudovirales phage]